LLQPFSQATRRSFTAGDLLAAQEWVAADG
jgi:hypothetical protein